MIYKIRSNPWTFGDGYVKFIKPAYCIECDVRQFYFYKNVTEKISKYMRLRKKF